MDAWIGTLTLCVLLGMTSAWTHGLTRKAYKTDTYQFPWAPARRSAYIPCSYTGQGCKTTSQCCNEEDICLTSFKYNTISGRVSTCQNMRKEMKYAIHSGHLKPSGQICSDSMQCADFCCREVRGHRSRYYVCGTPEDDLMSYTCIQASRTGNDVLDNLI